MEDKTQDVNSLQELVKEANAYSGWLANLANELSKVLDDIQTSKKEEDTWEMECPYVYGDKCFIVGSNGCVCKCSWDGLYVDEEMFNQGHIFSTEEEAELEVKRRNLLTRFRAFRDECNGDWKPDLSNRDEQWKIDYKEEEGFIALWTNCVNAFPTFGYFRNGEDAERAIELFGDEIKELFVECD